MELGHKINRRCGIANFRDLGGIVTRDGRHIRYGLLFRSGHHARLRLSRLPDAIFPEGLAAVIDLRTDEESACRPDRKLGKIRQLHLPLLSEAQNPAVTPATRKRVLKGLVRCPGGPKGHLIACYRAMISSEQSRRNLSVCIKTILKAKGGVVWHCTQGKDRAGVCTAVVLLALGVDRETVLQEYMRTNFYCLKKNLLCCVGTFIGMLRVKYVRGLWWLLTARREYLQAALDEIDRLYGGTEEFLTRGLHLTPADLERLKALCLA